MHARLVAAVAQAAADHEAGRRVNVTALSAELGISPKTFYKYADRYRQEGLAGLEERSRRPHRTPGQTPPGVEDVIVRWRKQLKEDGVDFGADAIRDRLEQDGLSPVPSETTIWRVLVRRGHIVAEPRKRPKSSLRRFEAAAPNECWQIDATEWALANGTGVEIINIVDDHSRLWVAGVAVRTTTSQLAWDAFLQGVARCGWPAGCLSDNGLAFSGRLRGFEVFFEAKLRGAGVRPITARPYHPQTCGKIERFQQTLKKWLRARRRARTIAELQAQLDTFRHYYNRQRPHRGIGRMTPWQRWSASPRVTVTGVALPAPARRGTLTVGSNGTVAAGAWVIGIGTQHAGQQAEVLIDGDHATVFIEDRLVRDLQLDRTRRYQPTGKPPGRPPRRVP